MDFHNINLPPDVLNHMAKTFSDAGLSTNDPIGNVVVAQVSMFEMQNRRRRGVLALFFMAAAVLAVGSYFFGRWNEAQEMSKIRPMITVTNLGSSLVYGTQAGQSIIKVTSGKDKIKEAWAKGDAAYILVQ